MSNFKQKTGVRSDTDVRQVGDTVYNESGINSKFTPIVFSGSTDATLSGNLQVQIDDSLDYTTSVSGILQTEIDNLIVGSGGATTIYVDAQDLTLSGLINTKASLSQLTSATGTVTSAYIAADTILSGALQAQVNIKANTSYVNSQLAAVSGLADSALQPGDAISLLNNDANFVNQAGLNAVSGALQAEIDLLSGGLNPARFDKIYHLSISGSDALGDGTLNAPFATLEKVQSLLPTNLTIDQRVAVMLGVGDYSFDFFILPSVYIIGQGPNLTRVLGEVGLNASGIFNDGTPQAVGLYDLTVDPAQGFNLDLANSPNNNNPSSILFITLNNVSVIPGNAIFIRGQNEFDTALITTTAANGVQAYNINTTIVNSQMTVLNLDSDVGIAHHITCSILNSDINQDVTISCSQLLHTNAVFSNSRIKNTLQTTGRVNITCDAVSLPPESGLSIDTGFGNTFERSTSAYAIKAGTVSPVNYSALGDTVKLHLEGIDTSLGTTHAALVQVQNRVYAGNPANKPLAIYDGGNLTSAGDDFQVSATDASGLILRANNASSYSGVDNTRNVQQRYWAYRPNGNVQNTYYNYYDVQADIDPDDSGFDWGDTSGGFSLFRSRFSHKGSGRLRTLDYDSRFLEMGNGTSSGTTGFFSGFNQNTVVRSNYTVEFLRNSYIGVTAESGSHIDQLLGLESNNSVTSGGIINNYTGLRFNLGNFGGVVSGNTVQAQFTLNGNPDGQYENVTLLNLIMNQEGQANNATGLQMTFRNDLKVTQQIGGIRINMGNYDASVERRSSIEAQNGTINFFNQLNTQSNLGFDQANLIINGLKVNSGAAISGTEFFSNNFSTIFLMEDDFTLGPIGLGACGLLGGGQIGVLAGKTVSKIQGVLTGFSVLEESNGGIVQELNMFSSFGVLSVGGSGTLQVDNLRTFYMAPGTTMATNKWGAYVEDTGAENYFSKSITVGSGSNQVSNSSVAIEISDKKALRLPQMTLAERNALTPLIGMIVCISDTNIDELQQYNGGAWVRTVQYVDAPATASSTGFPGQMATTSGWLYTCVDLNTWERTATLTF